MSEFKQPFIFTVPGKPQPWRRPRFNGKRGFMDAKTAQLEATIAVLAAQERGDRAPIDGPVRVAVCAQFEPPKSWSKKKTASAIIGEVSPTGTPDLDNLIKAITDACNTILYRDDAQIVELRASKRYAVQAGTIVTVEAAA